MKLFWKKNPKKALEMLLADCEVPSFPEITMRILQKIRDPHASAEEIAEALRWDPGLVVRLLKTVNSAAYGPAQAIHDVAHAATYMGRSQVEQVVLALAVKEALPRAPARGFEAERFWYTASCRASLASTLAAKIHPARQAECFTIGLLQDLAIPVLATERPADYGRLLETWHAEKDTHLDELERDAFGWCHGDVGAVLCRTWELPAELVTGIENHHRAGCTDSELPPALRLVSKLRETEREHGLEALVEDARSDYGLAPDWTRTAVSEAEAEASELARLLS